MYQHGGDIYTNKTAIDFSANINFFGMPDSVKQAAKDAVEDSVFYPDVHCRKLRLALAQREGVAGEHIFCGNGAADVIFTLVLAKKPKRALLPIPSFYEYRQALCSVQCRIDTYQMAEQSGFVLHEDFLDCITPETDMIFLCNPNNPTGLLTSQELLLKILKKCERTNTLLVLDECFMDFVEEPEQYSLLPWAEKSEQLFIIKAFTKMYAMPGLRLGYGICCDGGLLGQMERVSQPWRVSVPAQAAGVAAAGETEFVRKSRRAIRMERERMQQELREMGYETFSSQANFIFFEGERHLEEMMRERGFLIRDCSNYPGLHAGFYRIAVRSPEENEKLLEELRELHTGRR